MIVHLTTLCGCTREFAVEFPPPNEILIALNPHESDLAFLGKPPLEPRNNMPYRTFFLTEPVTDVIAFYIEK